MSGERFDLHSQAGAEDFVHELVSAISPRVGEGLIGVYLIGSLAHGGYSHRYSDVDVAFVTENGLSELELNEIRQVAAARSESLAKKLSIFWADRTFSSGRFPILDRLDLLDHGRPVFEREQVKPARPGADEIRSYLAGRPYSNWVERARAFAAADTLSTMDRKAYLRALLYPARLCYSWMEAAVGSNDEAVRYLLSARPAGLDIDLIERSLRCRQAAQDPDELFCERRRLLRQISVCSDMIVRTI